jgi:predicted AAA+ superfamily ATPase
MLVCFTMLVRRLTRPKTSFFLLGPRGTGKSTWARHALPNALLVDLLDEARYQDYLSAPGLLAAELRVAAPRSWVIIDEIQRLPSLLNEVHRSIEERGLRFALTSSSARKLRLGGTNLLGGRAQQLTMFPFVPEELAGAFRLERALRHGTLPLVWESPEPSATLRAYVQTYLKEEIQAEAAVRNLPGFARFLPVAERRFLGAGRGGRASDRPRLPRDFGGHVARGSAAGLRVQATRSRTAAPSLTQGSCAH